MSIGFLKNKNGSSPPPQSDVPHIFLTTSLNCYVKDEAGAPPWLPRFLSTCVLHISAPAASHSCWSYLLDYEHEREKPF